MCLLLVGSVEVCSDDLPTHLFVMIDICSFGPKWYQMSKGDDTDVLLECSNY